MRCLLISALLILVLVSAFVEFATAQSPGLSGNVVGVIDGRTLIVETGSGRLIAQLQHIETPEAGQPLHDVVKDHVSKLTLGKAVDFKPLRVLSGKTIGRITMNGVDLGLQLVRDGAAWHESPDTSGQPAPEATEYAANQQLAKSEKRGIWAIVGLKTPAEVRAEKEEQLRRIEAEKRLAHPTLVGVNEYQTARGAGRAPSTKRTNFEMGAWADVLGGVGKESPGLLTYKDPRGDFDVLYTSIAFVHLKNGVRTQKVECRVGYIMYRLMNGTSASYYVMRIRSISEDYEFSNKRSVMTVAADRQVISLGPAFGFKGREYYGAHELFFYKIGKSTLKKMSSAQNVELRVNGFAGVFPEDAKLLFGQLVAATQ